MGKSRKTPVSAGFCLNLGWEMLKIASVRSGEVPLEPVVYRVDDVITGDGTVPQEVRVQ
jgi:hypothetical protein